MHMSPYVSCETGISYKQYSTLVILSTSYSDSF
jgi:hypothetical protein